MVVKLPVYRSSQELRDAERRLTATERIIVDSVHAGLTNKSIATAIGSTEGVVKNHTRNIFNKLGVSNKLELALWAEARLQEANGLKLD